MRDQAKRARELSVRFDDVVASLASQERELVALERTHGPIDRAACVPEFLEQVFGDLAESSRHVPADSRSATLRGFVVRG